MGATAPVRVNNNLSYLHHMVSDPVFAVGQVNDATAGESELFQRTLHGGIIPMGINAKLRTLRQCPAEAVGCDTLPLLRNRNAMDHTVRTIVEPLTAVDLLIGGFDIPEIAKNCCDLTIRHA